MLNASVETVGQTIDQMVHKFPVGMRVQVCIQAAHIDGGGLSFLLVTGRAGRRLIP